MVDTKYFMYLKDNSIHAISECTGGKEPMNDLEGTERIEIRPYEYALLKLFKCEIKDAQTTVDNINSRIKRM